MTPIIKWAGGKRQLIPELIKNLPQSFNTYIEPFFGGGALYFHLSPTNAIINDFNVQLFNLYNQVKYNFNDFLLILTQLQNEFNQFISSDRQKEYYYSKRSEYNHYLDFNSIDPISAGLLVFLNKTGYNGLYRVNKNGLYNVPFGYKAKVNLFDLDNITQIHSLLANSKNI